MRLVRFLIYALAALIGLYVLSARLLRRDPGQNPRRRLCP